MDKIFDVIQQIGGYAGFAAVIGLAVLAALYFSQSRDLRRLLEQNLGADRGLAPMPPGLAAQRLQNAPSASRAPGATAVAQPPATVAGAAASKAPPPPGASPTPGPAGSGTAQAPPPPARRPALPTRPPSRVAPRQPLTPPPSQPWYARMEPRMLVLLVAGVLIVGGAVIFGVSSLGSGGEPESVELPQTAPELGATDDGQGPEPGDGPLDPSQVTVAVLNGTQVPGLAASTGDTIEAAGFRKGNVGDADPAATDQSVVMFTAGNEPAARAVAKELNIRDVSPIDPQTEDLGGNAEVVVIVGADQTQ